MLRREAVVQPGLDGGTDLGAIQSILSVWSPSKIRSKNATPKNYFQSQNDDNSSWAEYIITMEWMVRYCCVLRKTLMLHFDQLEC